nr:hypothetical protein CFP56_59286 [Quercus suber]
MVLTSGGNGDGGGSCKSINNDDSGSGGDNVTQPARALASKLSGEVPDCLFDDGASTLAALAASVGL